MKIRDFVIAVKHIPLSVLALIICFSLGLFIFFKSSVWTGISGESKRIFGGEVSRMKLIIPPGLLIDNGDGTASSVQGFEDCADGKGFSCIILSSSTDKVSVSMHRYSRENSEKLKGMKFIGKSAYEAPNDFLTVKYSNGAYALFRSDGSPVTPWNGAFVFKSTAVNN